MNSSFQMHVFSYGCAHLLQGPVHISYILVISQLSMIFYKLLLKEVIKYFKFYLDYLYLLLRFSSLLLHCLFISIITIYSAITHTQLISLTDTLLSYSFVYSTLLQAMHPQVYKPIVYLVDSLART